MSLDPILLVLGVFFYSLPSFGAKGGFPLVACFLFLKIIQRDHRGMERDASWMDGGGVKKRIRNSC